MDESVQELIHRSIDGEATPEQEARLQAAIAADPAARAEWEELSALSQMFEAASAVEPPGWNAGKAELLQRLHDRRLASTRSGAPAVGRTEGWFSRAAAALRPRLSPGAGFAFAAGALAGIALFATFGPGAGRVERLDDGVPGTILGSRRLEGGLVGEARLDLEDARGRAVSRMVGKLAQVEIDLESERPVELDLEFDPQVQHLRAFQQDAPESGQVVGGTNSVHIDHRGRNRYELWFEGGSGRSVEMRIRVRSGERVLERALRVFQEGPG
jgi:hypothetical protein